MKTSCIKHPEHESLIIVRQWQVEFCEGNIAAAALMSFFEYWHNIKLEISVKNRRLIEVADAHGETIEVDVSLYQWHTYEDLVNGIIQLAKSKATVNNALDFLVSKGVITIHNNPNPKYKFDRTNHYLFYPEVCNRWLNERAFKFEPPSAKIEPPSFKIEPAIPEISSEISSETNGADPKNLDEIFGPKETLAQPAGKRFIDMTTSELDQAILLGQNGSTVLEEHHWHIHSPIREGILAFITHSRLPVPRKKADRLYWENEVQEHIFTYGLDKLPDLYKQAVEEMRDRPLREKRHEAVMTIKSPKSVSGKIADLSTRQEETTSPVVRHSSGGYYL